jgi:spermidine/putrescine transport system substrate-binding protein
MLTSGIALSQEENKTMPEKNRHPFRKFAHSSPGGGHGVRTSQAAVLLLVVLLSACGGPATVPTPTPIQTEELIFYNWEEYMPQAVLDAFEAEYGIHVALLFYGSSEEADVQIKAKNVTYDIATVENDYLASLAAEGLLAEIHYDQVPNFKNISANFRDLAFDPDNKYSVPYNYGTTGLLVRSDLVSKPITRWADLWDPAFTGKVAVRADPVELISVAVKSLGYPLNTGDPAQLEASLERLLELKPRLLLVGPNQDEGVAPLLSGEAQVLVGWSGEAIYAQSQNDAITFILPEEGGMLWGDSFVISADSPNREAAELFLNFVLRPEISAQIVNAYSYPSANEAALPFVDPEIANNPVVYPSVEDIRKCEWYLPLGDEVKQMYNDIWDQLMSAAP